MLSYDIYRTYTTVKKFGEQLIICKFTVVKPQQKNIDKTTGFFYF